MGDEVPVTHVRLTWFWSTPILMTVKNRKSTVCNLMRLWVYFTKRWLAPLLIPQVTWPRGKQGQRGQSHISCQVESGQCSCWLGTNVGRHLWLSEQLFGRGPDKAHHGLEAGGQLGGQCILAWAERTPGSTLWTYHRRSKNVLTGGNLMA